MDKARADFIANTRQNFDMCVALPSASRRRRRYIGVPVVKALDMRITGHESPSYSRLARNKSASSGDTRDDLDNRKPRGDLARTILFLRTLAFQRFDRSTTSFPEASTIDYRAVRHLDVPRRS